MRSEQRRIEKLEKSLGWLEKCWNGLEKVSKCWIKYIQSSDLTNLRRLAVPLLSSFSQSSKSRLQDKFSGFSNLSSECSFSRSIRLQRCGSWDPAGLRPGDGMTKTGTYGIGIMLPCQYITRTQVHQGPLGYNVGSSQAVRQQAARLQERDAWQSSA